MNYRNLKHFLFVILLSGVLGGCATQGGVQGEQDVTGDLGQERKESPAKVYVDMGVAYLQDGKPAIALQKLKKGLALDPKYAQGHNVIAILYERLGEAELAGEHYERAVQLAPQDPYIRNAHGTYLCKKGNYEKAVHEFETALGNPLYATPWVAMTNAGLCLERNGEADQAETYYRKALSANSKYPQALYQMSELSLHSKNELSARAYLERYNEIAPVTAASLWLGIQIETRMGDRYRAAEYRRQLLDKFPDAPEIQLLHKSEQE